MNSLDPEHLLAIEDCEDVPELEAFVALVRAGMLPKLKQVLNRKLNTPDARVYSQLLSEVEKGNTSELVGTQLYPPLMSAVQEVLS